MVGRLLKHRTWIVFLGLVLLGLLLKITLLRYHIPHDSPWGMPPQMLGDALMVAGILGATVDWGLKRALVKDVGSIFIGWALPLPVRNYIRHVSETSIVRTCAIHYGLTVEGDHVVLDVTDSCDVYNYSTAIRRYESVIGIDRHEHPDLSSVRCVVTRNGKPSQQRLKTDDQLFSVHWKTRRFSLWPQDVNDPTRTPACQTRWEYRLRLPVNYSTVAAFGTPTLGVTITIDCHEPT